MKNCITITSAKILKSDNLGQKCQQAHAEVYRIPYFQIHKSYSRLIFCNFAAGFVTKVLKYKTFGVMYIYIVCAKFQKASVKSSGTSWFLCVWIV